MSYPGGKGGSGVHQAIINEQPPHETYIEPFLGAGSIMLAKRPASTTIGIDANPRVIAAFRDAAAIDVSGVPGSRTILCADALRWLSAQTWTGRELVYCDPPYLMESRKCQRRLYACEFAGEGDHIFLIHILKKLPCMVQISGYWNSLYAEMLEGWRLIRFQAMTRGGPAEECLWMNYPKPLMLHDHRFVGRTYRERERIQRKVRRWCERMRGQSDIDRIALLSAMAADSAFAPVCIAGLSDASSSELAPPEPAI
jgi:hypothetical protein